MNILFYLQQFPAFGGIENVTATLARSFSEVGHSVIILSHAEKPAAEICASLPDLVRQLKMPDQQHVVSTLNKSFLKETIEKNRVEVVIFQDSYARLDGNLIGTLGSCRLIVCEHNSPHHVFCRANAKTLTFREVLGRIKYPFSHRL
ncbi:MAG TPA: glycosyltransferase, partial [Candidatus Omnitrophota bacterium]|nr:glycosyltransferase [Candidatus Omnitrophota bacterium]